MPGVISYVAQDFGIELTALDSVGAGADRAAQNFRAHAAGSAYAIKWSSGGSVAGLMVSARLAEREARSVAAPVRTRDGRLWSEREGRRLSVVPWVGDRQAIEGGLDAGQWRAFGEVLAAAHALPITEELAAALPVADHRGDLAAAGKVDTLLRSTAAPDATAAEVQRVWLEHADRIQAVSACVEQLAPTATPTAVCHTDAHLGNVLAAPGRVWLIDWDDAALSTPEHDLMFVLGGGYGDEHVGELQRAWFFQGYGTVSIDPARLTYWRGSRGLVDIAFLAEEAFTSGESDGTRRARALRMLADQLSPTGLIARALG